MVVLDITWLSAAYEAEQTGGGAEWPPHPARAFCALVSVAQPGSADDDALRWLESLPPPVVEAPAASVGVRDGFVVTNKLVPKGGHQTYLGRTSGSRKWSRSLPDVRRTRMVWAGIDPAPDVMARLDDLARRVPYLGRSTSPALLSFSATSPDEVVEVALESHEPDPAGSERLRTPYPGYLDALRVAFESFQPASSVQRSSPYRPPGTPRQPAPSKPAKPVFPHLVTLGFEPGANIDGRHALDVAAAFKAAVLSRLGTPEAGDPWTPLAPEDLALLHGHYDHADGRRQCAFTALANVGHAHARGEVLGVGLGISTDLEIGVLSPLLRLLGLDRDGGPRLDRLWVGGRKLVVQRADRRRAVTAERWTSPSRRWDSVLPVVLDRYPRRSYSVEDALADGCEMAGLPRPVEVVASTTSVVLGSPHIPKSAFRREGGPTRPAVHAAFLFAEAVAGPVIVGNLRHLGMGLCVPIHDGRAGEFA